MLLSVIVLLFSSSASASGMITEPPALLGSRKNAVVSTASLPCGVKVEGNSPVRRLQAGSRLVLNWRQLDTNDGRFFDISVDTTGTGKVI